MNGVSVKAISHCFVDMPSAQIRAEAARPDKANFLATNELGSCKGQAWKSLAANIRIMQKCTCFVLVL
jgi:hypothetical protein